jgi:uncharacterized protein
MPASIPVSILLESWNILVESAPYMLFGFLAAGLLKAFVPTSLVARHLSSHKGGVGHIFKAAVIGAPLPLCSCSVLPAAAGLKDQGASRGATTAFLVATPETGVDSIAVSYALLDPVMTVLRPVAAIFTAVLAGIGVERFSRQEPTIEHAATHPLQGGESMQPARGCGCVPGGCAMQPALEPKARPSEQPSVVVRARQGMAHAFGDILGDIGLWFLLGVLLAGAIGALLPAGLLETWLGGPWAMFAALVVAVPLYVCATASTPLAAALVLKGLSPGAALVFLLAGPATNVATITVVAKVLGRRAAGLYVAAIALGALLLGFATDWLYRFLGLSTAGWMAESSEHGAAVWEVLCAVLLLVLIARAAWLQRRKLVRRGGEA